MRQGLDRIPSVGLWHPEPRCDERGDAFVQVRASRVCARFATSRRGHGHDTTAVLSPGSDGGGADPGQGKAKTRLQAAERYGMLGNAQGEVGNLAVRKGKGLASSASARIRARCTHGVATAAALRLGNGGVVRW